ncbi:unnamed protein product [Allacma fusca]|uniref:Lipoprotein n=1 Tax=Allacma fusca TaxID=39272 RepID=A0A8J2JL70_9HEXA|nr:unnamed protein product [Allacma fusca]
MKELWLGIWVAICLIGVSCFPRGKIVSQEMGKFEQAQSLLNETRTVQFTIAEDISEALKNQAKLSKNATKAMEKLAVMLNNGSLSPVDMVNYLPAIVLKDSRLEVSQFLKNLRKNAIRNAATLNNFITTLSNVAGAEETIPERFGIQEPATLLDSIMGFGRILTDSSFNTAQSSSVNRLLIKKIKSTIIEYWYFKSIFWFIFFVHAVIKFPGITSKKCKFSFWHYICFGHLVQDETASYSKIFHK